MTVDSWADRAACLGHPADWWWPDTDAHGDNHGHQAKAVCATCPVVRPCLEAALERREEHGIWGGAGGDYLRALRRAWAEGGDRWEREFAAHLGRLDGNVVEITNRNGPGATHGLPVTYARGCRCAPCTRAVADRDRPVEGNRSEPAVVLDLAARQAARVPAFLTATRTETA